MSRTVRIALAGVVVLLIFCAWLGIPLRAHIPESPELALESFYKREVAEDQIMDPLILAGPDVVPLLARELPSPEMPNRRYAIGALGNIGSKAALPILEQLARSTSEVDYIRCDAVTAIAMIDHQQGLRVVNRLRENGPACLSEIAGGLDRDYSEWLRRTAPRRTYFQALLGWHL